MPRTETGHRRRGDGLIARTLCQVEAGQPRDEDVAWTRGLIEETFGAGGLDV